ncbi:phosducin-like protein [Trichogramma pretiosum]|uniref:phosducin-like protein n=1 Tax=Trichogramma pretiosum TaxID=7493 RepID=UPI0006C96D6F|nr:phosducin-like protein [Trichogramma pretiosum]XP_014228384.1 phosducin-like protein [Trichogramma pretiosum]XP_023313718.1 phosducin-like protein [Trichogramma pretiosum]
MATLEDKILGEKSQYYCSSSSEDEDESNSDKEEDAAAGAASAQPEQTSTEFSEWDGTSSNTGPKGVIRDWQRFKQIETEKRAEQEKERVELMKKLSFTCQSQLDEERAKMLETDPDLAELMADQFLLDYQKQRMMEMMAKAEKLHFGQLFELAGSEDFLNAIDNEDKTVTVIVHIYQKDVPACDAMNGCLITLAEEYPAVKFCKIIASKVGVSKHFKKEGVPALLVYKNGQIIGNFVQLSASLGDDFYSSDVESFLIEHGLLNDKRCVPAIIKSKEDDDSDSD